MTAKLGLQNMFGPMQNFVAIGVIHEHVLK